MSVLKNAGSGLARFVKNHPIWYIVILVGGFLLTAALFNDWMGLGYEIEKATNDGFKGYWWKYAIVGVVIAIIGFIAVYAVKENKKYGKHFD